METLYYCVGMVIVWAVIIGLKLTIVFFIGYAFIQTKFAKVFIDLQKFPSYAVRIWNKTDEQIESMHKDLVYYKAYKKTHFRLFKTLTDQIRGLKKIAHP